jgi:flagellar biosynthesis protein FlhB
LVIAYPDEETLRDLIAAPSIVARGYTSRADAVKNIDRCATTKSSLEQLLKMTSLYPDMTFLTVLRRLARGFGLSGTSKVMRNLLHSGLAAALIFFYSRNVLSSAVRAFISS